MQATRRPWAGWPPSTAAARRQVRRWWPSPAPASSPRSRWEAAARSPTRSSRRPSWSPCSSCAAPSSARSAGSAGRGACGRCSGCRRSAAVVAEREPSLASPGGAGQTRSSGQPGGTAESAIVSTSARLLRQANVAEILAERGEVDAAPHGLPAAPRLLHRLGDLGLSLEHVIAVEVLELLAREPDQTKPV